MHDGGQSCSARAEWSDKRGRCAPEGEPPPEGFDEQNAEIREVAEEVVRKLADTLQEAVGEAEAANLLSQWEGFGRFCRQCLGVEPLVLVRAFGMQLNDSAAEVRAAYPDAAPDVAEVKR